MASRKDYKQIIAALVRGGLKNANDAHPDINNYNGHFSSVEKRLTNNIIAFVERTFDDFVDKQLVNIKEK